VILPKHFPYSLALLSQGNLKYSSNPLENVDGIRLQMKEEGPELTATRGATDMATPKNSIRRKQGLIELAKNGILVSESGARSSSLRCGLEKFKKRLNALE
jgi:hypothetical protein